jgi:hypothetical protein
MFIAIATVLATCTIADAVDTNGIPVPKDVEYKTGMIRYVLLQCPILPVVGS